MNIRAETITPKMAERYLTNCGRVQYRLHQRQVSRFASDMRSGNWKQTSMPIVFCCDGELLDGMHRMAAIVESGVSIKFLVIRNAPKDVCGNIDELNNLGDSR